MPKRSEDLGESELPRLAPELASYEALDALHDVGRSHLLDVAAVLVDEDEGTVVEED